MVGRPGTGEGHLAAFRAYAGGEAIDGGFEFGGTVGGDEEGGVEKDLAALLRGRGALAADGLVRLGREIRPAGVHLGAEAPGEIPRGLLLLLLAQQEAGAGK